MYLKKNKGFYFYLILQAQILTARGDGEKAGRLKVKVYLMFNKLNAEMNSYKNQVVTK